MKQFDFAAPPVKRLPLPEQGNFFQSLFPRQEPIIFECSEATLGGALPGSRNFPDLIRFFRRRIGQKSVTFSERVDKASGWKETDTTFLKFADLLSDAAQDTAVCIKSHSIPHRFPEIGRITFPLVPDSCLRAQSPRLWIGNGSRLHETGIHADRHHNFACQIAGEKHFLLFPPDQLPNLYVGPLGEKHYRTPVSYFDLAKEGAVKYPKFKQALDHARQGRLRAGEALFLPSHWWHNVWSINNNIMINFWWDDIEAAQEKEAHACFLHALLAINSLPAYRRAILAAWFDYFIFERCGDPIKHLKEQHRRMSISSKTPEMNQSIQQELLRLLIQNGTLEGLAEAAQSEESKP